MTDPVLVEVSRGRQVEARHRDGRRQLTRLRSTRSCG